MNDIRPNKTLRVLAWAGINASLWIAVAVTNGFIIYFLATVASCMISTWMLTPFLMTQQPKPAISPAAKIVLMAVGIICGAVLTYGHPLFFVVTIGVTIHAMRILNRYSLGYVSAIVAPIVALLPLIPISHASYVPLTLSSITYAYEAIAGYVWATIIVMVAVALLKRDDIQLLSTIGKSPEDDAFESVGMPRGFAKHNPTRRRQSNNAMHTEPPTARSQMEDQSRRPD